MKDNSITEVVGHLATAQPGLMFSSLEQETNEQPEMDMA